MTGSSVSIVGGRVVDRTSTDDHGRPVDLRIENGVITHVVESGAALPPSDAILDAAGCIVTSGLVDLHVHLREPGREESETIETGSRAAARGGFTAVVAMPNTEPPHDSRVVVDFVREQGRRAGLCEVIPSGCITVGRAGEHLAPFAELRDAGVRLFTDDGSGVQDPQLMRRALEYARDLDITLAQHCEVASLTHGAVMHEGACCSRLGLPGWPALAEELMVHRDIELCRLTGAGMHFLHLSTARSVELVRRAKADGLPVTAEATPHHVTLTDEALSGFDPIFKVNPPLRTPADIEALKVGLADGTIDAIATDHAPHAPRLKEQPLDEAPPGMIGLETALGLAVTHLVDTGRMSLREVLGALSWRPARIARVDDRHGRPVAAREPANLTVIDMDATWTVMSHDTASRSRNTPFVGHTVRGRVRHTVLAGQPVVVNGSATR